MSDPVVALLNNNGLGFTASGKDYLIKCLNPKHEDSNPSLRVDKMSGVAHCLACGWSRNLFRHFGVFTSNVPVKIAKLKEKLAELNAKTADLEMPKGAIPYTEAFRGISPATLKHFGAFYTHDVEILEDRICFPITNILGKIVVFSARHVLTNATPRYVFYPKHHTPPCYPSRMPDGVKSIVLVEGIFDLLNLYDKDVTNVVCAFGTQTFKNSAKEKLLGFKAQGVEKIYVLYDGDKAGREAAAELKPVLEDIGFIVEILDLPDDQDPGVLAQDDVDKLKEYIDNAIRSNNRQSTEQE